MQQLSGLDAGFLTLETPNAPMAIGGVSVLDPRREDGSRLDVDGFRAVLRERLGRTLAFRRRLGSVPLDLTRPYWIEMAPDEVDLEAHIEKTTLPSPGSWHELGELMAFELAQPLDRSRPLWQMIWVEGVDGIEGVPEGSVALIGRVHHAAIDGVSGAEILAALFDGIEIPAASRGNRPAPEPRALEMIARAGKDLAATPAAATRTVGRSLLGLAGSAWSRLRTEESSPLPFDAPRTALNRSITRDRAWAPAFLELERIRAIKAEADATVNDVVLAVCSGALRNWLLEEAELPEKPLVAMCPVSVRASAERRDEGNQVSAMLVALATEESDPTVRLRRIRDNARASKVAHQAVGAKTLVRSADLFPFALSGAATRLYSRLHLAEKHRPMFNLVITNVPGPPRPLSVGGAKLLAHVGTAPVFDGLGLILPVFSYAGMLSIGVTADRAILPRPRIFAHRLEAALDELELAVLGQ